MGQLYNLSRIAGMWEAKWLCGKHAADVTLCTRYTCHHHLLPTSSRRATLESASHHLEVWAMQEKKNSFVIDGTNIEVASNLDSPLRERCYKFYL